MCQQCLDAVNQYFPGISGKEKHALLWESTAFPFVHGEYITQQLSTLRSQIDGLKERPGFVSGESGDVGIACAISHAEIDMAMKNRVSDRK